jgi:hypothetical protein
MCRYLQFRGDAICKVEDESGNPQRPLFVFEIDQRSGVMCGGQVLAIGLEMLCANIEEKAVSKRRRQCFITTADLEFFDRIARKSEPSERVFF